MQPTRARRTVLSSLPQRIVVGVQREIVLQWSFIHRDVSATLVPASLFVLAAWASMPGAHLLPLGSALIRGAVYFWLYILTFCLSNQLAGIDEDRLNKPDRPLPAGAVSRAGAWQRWGLASGLFVLVAWWWGVLLWAVLWWTIATLHNVGQWARHWPLKHLTMVVGTIAQLAAAWSLVTPLTPEAWQFLWVLAVGMGPLFAAQDLRDMVGDAAIGRRTLPLVLGSARTRWLLSGGFVVLPILLGGAVPLPLVWPVLLAWGGCTLLSWSVAWRFWRYRTAGDDHQTYMRFTYWYCAVLATSTLIFAV